MNRWSGARLVGTILTSALLAAVVGWGCLWLGSTGFGWPQGFEYGFRLDAVLNSALIGAALAAAGVAYQAVLRNPLADPYLLGVSSGAALAGYCWSLPRFAAIALTLGTTATVLSQQAFSFLGAIIAVTIVLAMAGRRGRLEPVTLLLVGVIVNAVNGSIFLLIDAMVQYLPGVGSPVAFLVGGIQVIDNHQRYAALALIAIAWIVLLYLTGELNAAGLDDGEAHALGVRIHRLRWITLITASLATAAAVAISGPIGFVGLVCPHVARLIVGSDQRKLLPLSTALGAILLMLADGLSRFLAAENRLGTQLQVGILTGLLGGPFFLWLLLNSRRKVVG